MWVIYKIKIKLNSKHIIIAKMINSNNIKMKNSAYQVFKKRTH